MNSIDPDRSFEFIFDLLKILFPAGAKLQEVLKNSLIYLEK
jgi:hypothetical protein